MRWRREARSSESDVYVLRTPVTEAGVNTPINAQTSFPPSART